MLTNEPGCPFSHLPLWLHECNMRLRVFWCMCRVLRSCARKRVQLLHVSESEDKHRLSACLPAARVIDVDGNTQTAAEELLTHERQTR